MSHLTELPCAALPLSGGVVSGYSAREEGFVHWMMLITAAWAGDCPDFEYLGTDAASASSRLAEAEGLYPEIYERFAELPDLAPWVIDGISCLREPATPSLATRYHRFRAVSIDPLGGLGSTVRGRAAASLSAVARLDPEHASALPADHGHQGAIEPSMQMDLAPAPVSGTLFFDGVESLLRPSGSATFFQLTDGQGLVLDSAYLFPGDALPDYARAEVVADATDAEPGVGALPEPEPVERSASTSRKKSLRIAGAVLGATALGLFAGNQVTLRAAVADDSSRGQALDAQPLVNGLAFGAWGAGAASAGLFTYSFAVK